MRTSIPSALCAIALAIGLGHVSAQTPTRRSALWSLDDCISYAIENNIDVQKQVLQIEQRKNDLSTARSSRLPDLNASIRGTASFGRVLSSDNTYKNENDNSGSLGVSTTIPVFQGFQINRQIKGGKLDLAAAIQDLGRVREDLQVNVTALYLQVLFNKELLGVAEEQLALSTQQVAVSRTQVAAGKQPESTLYESESLQANDALSLTQAQNDLQMSLVDLSQALNRESARSFDVVMPTLDDPTLAALHNLASIEEVYAYAADNRPNVLAERLRLASAQNAISTARSALWPTLSFSAGYGTNVYSNDLYNSKFWPQIRHNQQEYIGLTLNIPIFNRLATRNNIRSARIAAGTQALAVTDAERTLRKEIEQAWYNADAAYSKYTSAGVALVSAKVAFEYEEQKNAAGRSTLYDFNDAKTRMEKAASDLIQAKYEFVFRSKILAFYNGQPITL